MNPGTKVFKEINLPHRIWNSNSAPSTLVNRASATELRGVVWHRRTPTGLNELSFVKVKNTILNDQFSLHNTELAAQKSTGLEVVARLLTPADITALMALREQIFLEPSHGDRYVRESNELAFLKDHLGSKGMSIGLFVEHRMMAYAMLGVPTADDEHNLGCVLGLNKLERKRVAHLASCMVAAPFRGYRLQQTLLQARFDLARSLDRTLCIGTVSLHNHASRRNLLSCGCSIQWVGEINDNHRRLQRHLFVKELAYQISFEASTTHLVDPLDFWFQRTLCESGFIGVEERLNGFGHHLLFVRKAPAQHRHERPQ